MKNFTIYLCTIVLVAVSCKNKPVTDEHSTGLDTAAFLTEISTVDSIMASGMPEKKDIKKAIVVYQKFANYFPNDPKTPDYLFQVSDFHLNMG